MSLLLSSPIITIHDRRRRFGLVVTGAGGKGAGRSPSRKTMAEVREKKKRKKKQDGAPARPPPNV